MAFPLLLTVLLTADPCASPSGNAIEQNLALAPVFLGGLVVRATDKVEAVQAALAEAGLTGATIQACPEGRLVLWVPASTASLVPMLTKQAGLRGVESTVITPSEGTAWIQKECRDVGRCKALAEQASPMGLCGLALGSLDVALSEKALSLCRALEPAAVACVIAGDRRCQRALRATLRK